MLHLSEPEVIERGPYLVVGCWHPYEGDDEGPGWAAAYEAFQTRQDDIRNRADSMTLGFLYRPHADHPEVPAAVRACFIGVEVAAETTDFPGGLSTARFPGGRYVTLRIIGDTQAEATEGVGGGRGATRGLGERARPRGRFGLLRVQPGADGRSTLH